MAKEKTTTKNQIVIDADGLSLGRLASQVAFYLMGKNNPEYERHNLNAANQVIVKNAEKIKFTGNKLTQKIYFRHSGYPGGLKKEVLGKLIEKKGVAEVVKRAVYGMLPKNKLRREMMKNLKIYKGEEA